MSSVVRVLRDVAPVGPLSLSEALLLAELQATMLLELSGITGPPVPESVIADLPRIRVERMRPSPVSGATHWNRGHWLIVLSAAEPPVRQRFSLAHEFKHILDHPFIGTLYPARSYQVGNDRAEQACNYFAACLLMPRTWVKREWRRGTRDLRALSRRFAVSQQAMQVRLLHIGLTQPVTRTPRPYRKEDFNRAPLTRSRAARDRRSVHASE